MRVAAGHAGIQEKYGIGQRKSRGRMWLDRVQDYRVSVTTAEDDRRSRESWPEGMATYNSCLVLFIEL